VLPDGLNSLRKSEEELRREGFKMIKASYGGTCSFCGRRYQPGEEIYWKNMPSTRVCCPRCYGGISSPLRIVRCPNCGHEFSIDQSQ